MDWMAKKNVLIVGLGLMGGSYARALKRLGYHVTAIDRSGEAIAYALRERIISEGAAGENEDLVRNADAIIFALYPRRRSRRSCRRASSLSRRIRWPDGN